MKRRLLAVHRFIIEAEHGFEQTILRWFDAFTDLLIGKR